MNDKEKQFIEYLENEVKKNKCMFERISNNRLEDVCFSSNQLQTEDIMKKFKQIFEVSE